MPIILKLLSSMLVAMINKNYYSGRMRSMTLVVMLLAVLLGQCVTIHAALDLDPDRAQELIDMSSDKSPEALKGMELEVRSMLEKEMQATLHYLCFQGAVLLAQAYISNQSNWLSVNRKISGRQPLENLKKAHSILSSMDPTKANLLNTTFRSWRAEGSILFYFEKWLRERKNSVGRSFWQSIGKGSAVERVSTILPGQVNSDNFTSTALLASFMTMGVYPTTMQDAEISEAFLAALDIQKKDSESFISAQEQPAFQRFFNDTYVSTVQKQTFEDSDFTAYFQKHIEAQDQSENPTLLQDLSSMAANGGAESVIEKAGHTVKVNRFSKINRAELKWLNIANLRRLFIRNKSNAMRMQWAFSLGKLSGSFIRGSILSAVAETLVESAIVLAAGQRREKIEIGGDKIEFDKQNTLRQKGKTWFAEYLNDRKFAFLDLAEDATDNWEARAAGLAGGVAVATLLGTSLPLTIAAAAVGYAAYSGVKAITSTELYQNFKYRGLIGDLEKMMKKMPYVKNELQLDDQKIRATAESRAREMMKRKEVGKQSPRRMYFVDRLSSLQYQKRGDYWYMLNGNKDFGRDFDVEAHTRYDIIDVAGQQGVWDQKTPEGIHNVGKLEKTSGADITFINADSTFDFHDGGKVLKSKKDSNFRVLTNGSIWVRDEENVDKWMVKGLTSNTDLIIREGKGRFTFDMENSKHIFVDETGFVPPRSDQESETGGLEKIGTQSQVTADTKSSASGNHQAESSNNEVLDDAFRMGPEF